MMRKTLLIATLLSQISPANAGFFDGNKLYEDCRSTKLFALGFVAGAYDANQAGQLAMFGAWFGAASDAKDMKPSDKFEKSYADGMAMIGNYCAPKGIILQQVVDIFCQYLTAKPGERHKPANRLLSQALNEAWPCKHQ